MELQAHVAAPEQYPLHANELGADRLAPKRPDPSAPATAAPDVTSGGAAHTHETGATAATPVATADSFRACDPL